MRLSEKHANIRKYQGGWLKEAFKIGASLFGSKGAQKRADADRARGLDLEERRVGISEKQDARSGELFDRYTDTYAPREDQLLSEAFDRPIDPDAEEARATADVRSSLQTARQMGDRNLRRQGVNPNSGAYVGLDRARGTEEARIEAGARTKARSNVRDLNFNRQRSVIGMGSNLIGSSAAYSGQAGAGLASAASLAGARSADSSYLAQQAGQSLGSAVGGAVDKASEWWKTRGRTFNPTSHPVLGT